MIGKVVGVCISQRRTDPKKNVEYGFVEKGLGLVGDAHAGSEKEVSLLGIESIQKTLPGDRNFGRAWIFCRKYHH